MFTDTGKYMIVLLIIFFILFYICLNLCLTDILLKWCEGRNISRIFECLVFAKFRLNAS